MRRRIVSVVCVIVMLLTAAVACNKKTAEAEYVAVINNTKVTRPIFAYALNEALNEVYALQPDNLSFDDYGTEDFLTQLKEATAPDSDKTYYDYIVELALETCKHFVVNLDLAKADADWPSDDELAELREEGKTSLQSAYAQYISYYGWTDDQLALTIYGMSMSDYQEFYALSTSIDSYNNTVKEAMTFTDEELEAFYNENSEAYRIVQVRHSLLLTSELTDDEKATILAKAEEYVEQIKNGEKTMDDIVALSEDTGVTSNNGYYDVVKDGSYVEPFEAWAVSREEISTEPEIVETSHGYHIMMCTSIRGFDDETVRENTLAGIRFDTLEKELEELAAKDEYEIKDINADVTAKFVRQIVTGNFDDEESSPTPIVTATPKPEYNDAAVGTDVVAKIGDLNVWYSDYVYFFSTAINEIVVGDITFEDDLSMNERYELLRNFLETKYKDEDITYLQKCCDRAMELAVQFKATWTMATESGLSYDEDKIKEINDELDTTIDQALSYYGSYYGVTTRDEYVQYVAGMNVNDYKRFNIEQTLISEYSTSVMEDMEPTEDEIKAYYDEHLDQYKTVTVRRVFLSLKDEDGNAISEEAAAEVNTLAERLIAKLKGGDSPEAIAVAYSEDENVSIDKGLIDLLGISQTLDEAIVSWAMTQTSIGVDTVTRFDTENGIEIILIEGILGYKEQSGVTASTSNTLETLASSLETAYKNEAFEKIILEYVEEHSFEATDIKQDLIDKVVEEYLTYEEEEEEADAT